jgi:hypothetical protein
MEKKMKKTKKESKKLGRPKTHNNTKIVCISLDESQLQMIKDEFGSTSKGVQILIKEYFSVAQ